MHWIFKKESICLHRYLQTSIKYQFLLVFIFCVHCDCSAWSVFTAYMNISVLSEVPESSDCNCIFKASQCYKLQPQTSCFWLVLLKTSFCYFSVATRTAWVMKENFPSKLWSRELNVFFFFTSLHTFCKIKKICQRIQRDKMWWSHILELIIDPKIWVGSWESLMSINNVQTGPQMEQRLILTRLNL